MLTPDLRAVKQLTTAFAPKQDRSPLAQAVQGLGDVMVVDLLFRRVASLLQAFQVCCVRLTLR